MSTVIKKISKDIAKLEFDNSTSLCREMYKLGFTEIGSGMFASCYSKTKSRYVIKAFLIEEDVPYFKYLKKIRKLDNPYTPKIYHIDIVQDTEGRRVCFVFMEKLHHIKNLPFKRLRELILSHFHFNIDHIDDDIYDDMCYRFEECCESFNNSLKKLVDILQDIKIDTGSDFDLHDGNIRVRKTNKGYMPVIIDPLYCP